MFEGAWPELWPLLVVVVGTAATYVWRALGVALSGRIRADGPMMELIGCIAYALLAGLVTRMILLPIGPLQTTAIATRLVALAVGIAAFYLSRHNLLLGVIAAAAALAALASLGL